MSTKIRFGFLNKGIYNYVIALQVQRSTISDVQLILKLLASNMTLNIIDVAICVVYIITFLYAIICFYRCSIIRTNRIRQEYIEAMELEAIHTALNTRTENAEETND